MLLLWDGYGASEHSEMYSVQQALDAHLLLANVGFYVGSPELLLQRLLIRSGAS